MKFIYFLLFVFMTNSNAQTNGICTYKIYPIEENFRQSNDSNRDKVSKILLEAFKIAEDFEYTLRFNQNESIAFFNETIINEGVKNNNLYSIAKALMGNGVFYQNRKENVVLHEEDVSGESFLIKNKLASDWEITNESKKIGGYLCFKATKKCDYCNSYDSVWFTPDIPSPFGPRGYGGLPGLIIQYSRKGYNLRLVSIKFTSKNIKIKRPKKGKRISVEEYNKMVTDIRKNG